MSQQPFSRPGAVDLSGLKQPAGGAAEGGAASLPGSSYSLQVTQENFQATVDNDGADDG